MGGIEGENTTGANTPTKSSARWSCSAITSTPSLPQAGRTVSLVEELDQLLLVEEDWDDGASGADGGQACGGVHFG